MPIPIRTFLVGLALIGSSALAFAAPGELTAVVRHCGPPGAESKETSPITNQLQRTLIYNNDLYLHFQPVAGGWAFTTAWSGQLPLTRGELDSRLPCFHNAMQDAANEVADINPTIAAQTVVQPPNGATFGIPHLWLIVALVITLLVFLILPSARQRRLHREARKPVEHIYRKPDLGEYIMPTPLVVPVQPRRPDLVEVIPAPVVAEPIGYRTVETVQVTQTTTVVEHIEHPYIETVEVGRTPTVAELIESRHPETVEVIHTSTFVEPIREPKIEFVEVPAAPTVVETIEHRAPERFDDRFSSSLFGDPVESRKPEYDDYLFSPRPVDPDPTK